MPDIDPAALIRSDTIPQSTSATSVTARPNGITTPLFLKTSKSSSVAQRIDLEPLYTNLKAAIGEHWGQYKEALSLFLLGVYLYILEYYSSTRGMWYAKDRYRIIGHLNQNELSGQIDPFVAGDLTIEHMHNQLLLAIYANAYRDVPDQGVAPWVSANDKPAPLSKPVSGDAAEQRLKTEVMQLPARDRRRLKEIPDVSERIKLIGLVAVAHRRTRISIASRDLRH